MLSARLPGSLPQLVSSTLLPAWLGRDAVEHVAERARAPAAGILAAGFPPAGTALPTRRSVLVVPGPGTRRRHRGGVTTHPTGDRTGPQARNLALTPGERSANIRVLIRDRGSNRTASSGAVFPAAGTTIVRPALQ